MRIVCIGDSLTYGYGVKRASVWTALASRAMPGSEIVNKGINGDTTGGMLSRFETDAAGSGPDVIFVMGGSNDIFFSGSIAEAKCNMAAMIFRCMHRRIRPVIGSPLPVYEAGLSDKWKAFASGECVGRLLGEYSDWLMAFADSFGVPLIDFRQSIPDDPAGTASFYLDGIHASEEGHRRMAGLWAESIMKLVE